MNVFYNIEGVGDTLIISLQQANREELAYNTKGQATRIYNEKTNETVGYNLFNVSKSFKISGNGQIELTEQLLEQINNFIKTEGFEEQLEADFSPKFVVGFVKEKDKHPNADKLSVCQVDVGNEVLQIVCGAANIDAGQKVVVAKVGATMPSGMQIKDAELRGVPSSGMICSARELQLKDAPDTPGILVLTDNYETGSQFEF